MRAETSGSFAVFSSDGREEMTPRGRKARRLLAYLISDPGTKHSKSHLASLLWGDRSDALARSSLRQALRELRLALNRTHEFVRSDREHIWLQISAPIEDSVDELHGYKEAFQDLDGLSPEFDEWLAQERSRRARRRANMLKAEAECLLSGGRFSDTLELVERAQMIDPHDEDALRLAMKAEFELGHPAAIAERYRAVAALLAADLGVHPSRQSRELRDRLIGRLTQNAMIEPGSS